MSFFGGGSNSGGTGYNATEINGLRDIINQTAQNAGDGIVQTLYDDIIVPMSTAWYAPEAVTFFEGFAETVKQSGENITKAFDSFRDAVEKAGVNWADNTGGEQPALAAIDQVELNLTVTDIKEKNDNGDVIIYSDSANTVANNLEEVENTIKENLENLAENLDAATAFIGGGQAEAIQDCFVEVSGEIHKIFKYLTEGEDSLQSQIKAADTKYGQVSTGISTAFNNGQ